MGFCQQVIVNLLMSYPSLYRHDYITSITQNVMEVIN